MYKNAGEKVFKLNEKSRNNIQKATGMTIEEIIRSDFKDIDKKIESKIGKKLEYPKMPDKRLLGRGQIYSYFNRFIDMQKINKGLKRIK